MLPLFTKPLYVYLYGSNWEITFIANSYFKQTDHKLLFETTFGSLYTNFTISIVFMSRSSEPKEGTMGMAINRLSMGLSNSRDKNVVSFNQLTV